MRATVAMFAFHDSEENAWFLQLAGVVGPTRYVEGFVGLLIVVSCFSLSLRRCMASLLLGMGLSTVGRVVGASSLQFQTFDRAHRAAALLLRVSPVTSVFT
jgi:TctA family transporter